MSDTIKWGIIGCGGIANKFADSLTQVEGTEIVACASRTPGKAATFAQSHSITDSHDNYEELVKRDDIQAVYVATTHNFHYENVKLVLEHSKAVLCEKPFTVTAWELRELITLAREKKVSMMEAMWTRFVPAVCQVREWLDSGVIGEVRQIRAYFGFNAGFDPNGRMYNKALAGGATLDAGIYPVSFASMVAKKQPENIEAIAHIGETGVDEQAWYMFNYGDNLTASIGSTCRVQVPSSAEIYGEKGKIVIPTGFIGAQEAQLSIFANNDTLVKRFPFYGPEGFRYEIQEVVNCLREGKLESEIMPLDESIGLMETLDIIRGKIGLVYDNDK